MMIEIGLGVLIFTVIVMLLVVFILITRSWLIPAGKVLLKINRDEDKSISVDPGDKLLNVLGNHDIFIPSACGGGGTCAQCRVKIKSGGGDILPTETAHITKREAKEGYRLSCQVNVKQDMDLELPAEIFSIRKWECRVRSNESCSTFIKELVLELPEGADLDFRAGGYIQIDAPPHVVEYKTMDIAKEYRGDWDKYNLWQYQSEVDEPITTVSMRPRRAARRANGGACVVISVRVRVAAPAARPLARRNPRPFDPRRRGRPAPGGAVRASPLCRRRSACTP